MISALLTAIGIAVLNIESQSLATFLLLAGAGLAAAIILSSGHMAADASPSQAQSAIAQYDGVPSQFTELLVRQPAHAGIDRAAWAKLTAHMSHELRTPLNAVLGFSELMSKEVFGPLGSSAYSEYARDIHASGRQLLKSAEDALAITALLTAAPHKSVLQSCRLKLLLDDAHAFTEGDLVSRSIIMERDMADDVEIVGDPQAMRQMLINLVSEALRRACSGAVIYARAHTSNETVTFSIVLSEQRPCEMSETEGFAMILARTICELSGARLAVTELPAGGAAWTVHFAAATQSDLFAKRI